MALHYLRIARPTGKNGGERRGTRSQKRERAPTRVITVAAVAAV